MSTIYPKYSLGLRLGLFAGMYSIAGAFAGLIAYGIFQIKSSSLHNWQWLFIIEGALSVVMAAVTVFILPARLESAWCMLRDSKGSSELTTISPQRDRSLACGGAHGG